MVHIDVVLNLILTEYTCRTKECIWHLLFGSMPNVCFLPHRTPTCLLDFAPYFMCPLKHAIPNDIYGSLEFGGPHNFRQLVCWTKNEPKKPMSIWFVVHESAARNIYSTQLKGAD